MLISEYFKRIHLLISELSFVTSSEVNEDVRTLTEGYIKAKVFFTDGSILSFREYVSAESEPIVKLSYSYHYYKGQSLIFRYDNAPHHKELSSFPHHKHLAGEIVIPCLPATIESVLSEIQDTVSFP